MKSAISRKAAAAGAGLLLIAAVGATVAFNSTSASGVVVPKATAAAGKPSIFVKFDTIKGQSTAKAHKDFADATSMSGGFATPGTGRPVAADIVITKPIDIATPKLLQAAVNNMNLAKVEIDVDAVQATGLTKTVTKYLLSNARVTSDTFATTSAGEVEKVTLSYQKIEVSRQVGPGSPVVFMWDNAVVLN
jgi:type VI secretion system Hcp family effector